MQCSPASKVSTLTSGESAYIRWKVPVEHIVETVRHQLNGISVVPGSINRQFKCRDRVQPTKTSMNFKGFNEEATVTSYRPFKSPIQISYPISIGLKISYWPFILFIVDFEMSPKMGSHNLQTHRRGAHMIFFPHYPFLF